MISAVVYIIFLGLLFILISRDKEDRYCALFLGIVLFPSCIWTIDSPKMLVQHIFLYTFFAIEIVKNFPEFKRAIQEFPLKIPLLLIIISFICTVYTTQGLNPKEYYSLLRYVIDLYGYLFAAYLLGRKADSKTILNKLFIPLLILGFCGIFEGMFNANYLYKYICLAFPHYDGFYDLASDINACDSWRIRTLLTTTYPTAYSTLLCGLILLYIPNLKEIEKKNYLKVLLVAVLLINLLLCGCRTGMVCAGAALAFFIVRKWPILVKITIVVALVFASFLYAQKVIENFSQENRGSSLQLREQQLIFSIIQIANKPVFGNGVSYLTKYIFETDTYGDRIRDDDIMGMESILFPKLINYGFAGLFLYFLLCGWIFVYFYKRRHLHSMASTGYLLIFAVTVFFIMSGNMGNASAYIYLIIGLILGNIQKLEKSSEDIDKPKEIESKPTETDVRDE